MQFRSQIKQDVWVVDQMKGKRHGTFVDIGCAHPTYINNTYVLEKYFGWTGVSVDIGPPYTYTLHHLTPADYLMKWQSKRKSPLILGDAMQVDFRALFESQGLPSVIDYLSMDIEPPSGTLACLFRLPLEHYRFNVITYETDHYRGENTREPSREFLLSHGYKLAVPGVLDRNGCEQEDWYVHEDFAIEMSC